MMLLTAANEVIKCVGLIVGFRWLHRFNVFSFIIIYLYILYAS